MMTVDVPLSEIDFDDREYGLFNYEPDTKLEDSINTLGVVNPVKLLKKGSGFVVITGWKRLNALKKLNLKNVYSQVYEENELKPIDLYSLIYIDNKDRITDLEKAELIFKLIKTCYLSEKELINGFLPVIGINPSLNNLKKYLSIASLEKELKDECIDENISFEQLQMLSEIEDLEFRKEFYTHLLKQYRFNNNETRELIKDIQTICIRNKMSVSRLAETVLNQNEKKPDKNTFRKMLKTICYPSLSETEQKYNELIKDLNLGNSSRLINHPYFESNEIELRIKFKEQSDLLNEIESIKNSADNGKIEKLLKLIKEGI